MKTLTLVSMCFSFANLGHAQGIDQKEINAADFQAIGNQISDRNSGSKLAMICEIPDGNFCTAYRFVQMPGAPMAKWIPIGVAPFSSTQLASALMNMQSNQKRVLEKLGDDSERGKVTKVSSKIYDEIFYLLESVTNELGNKSTPTWTVQRILHSMKIVKIGPDGMDQIAEELKHTSVAKGCLTLKKVHKMDITAHLVARKKLLGCRMPEGHLKTFRYGDRSGKYFESTANSPSPIDIKKELLRLFCKSHCSIEFGAKYELE